MGLSGILFYIYGYRYYLMLNKHEIKGLSYERHIFNN